ncbi:hypothetical protein [Rhodoferax sp.]|uniref:hypothetical protein n=1 Tax=Rhodoferax sp. TaxID=50421 RepID=UPI00374DCCF1
MNDLKEGDTTCPLGHKCFEVKGDTIHRCAWSIKLAGVDGETGKNVDEYRCAMGWLPILLIENSQQQRSTAAAVESFRNEVAQGNDQARAVLLSQLPLMARARVIGQAGPDDHLLVAQG